MRAKQGPSQAVLAGAHKLGRIRYSALKSGEGIFMRRMKKHVVKKETKLEIHANPIGKASFQGLRFEG